MKRILLTLSAVLALNSCIQDELLDSQRPSESGVAVTFESYLGRDAVTRATVEDATTLMDKGFGVMGWYTGQDDYAEDYTSEEYDYDFMINTMVSNADGTGWSYTPLKYWPNNYGDKLTFLAYAPYNAAYSAVADGTSTALSRTIDFTVANEVKDQIDLLWSDNPENENMIKPAVDSKVLFTFKHALSRIGFKVAAFVDDVRTEEGSASETLDANTVINVKKVMLVNGTTTYNADNSVTPVGVFYTGGTLDLYNFTSADASEIVPAAWEETLPADVTDAQYFELTAEEHFTNTTTDGDGATVFQLSGDSATTLQTLNAEDSYIMIIPQDFTNDFTDGYKVYIEYDVVTTGDNALGETDSSTITNCILSEEALMTNFFSGKAYTLNVYLGMTSVKFDVVVEDWVDGDPADTDEDLPANMEEESGDGGVDDEILNAEGFAGAGTPEKPYKISTAAQLVKVSVLVNARNSNYVSASYIMTNDIDMTGTAWMPIGEAGTEHGDLVTFDGTFDGAGYSILNLETNETSGLFHELGTAAVVKNLNVSALMNGCYWAYSGGIAGENNGLIIGCSFSGKVNMSGEAYAAAIVSNNLGKVVGCYNAADVIAGVYSAGVVGNNEGTVISCYNTGEAANAIVGYNYKEIMACYYNSDNSGIGGSSSDDYEIKYVDDMTISWADAITAMNKTLADNGYEDWYYVENTDDATKGDFPLLIKFK